MKEEIEAKITNCLHTGYKATKFYSEKNPEPQMLI